AARKPAMARHVDRTQRMGQWVLISEGPYYIMLGESDALLRVVVSDLEDYRRFQSTHLTRRNGIQTVKTDVPSETIKQTFALPL
ncbi:Lrp/AsnC ligand binding domain-containing protein, partial [Shinella sp. GWS1]|uniref:Lrp/AsnC ligand binding domain-containing protein n=1 Tax=Shinella sp. GWS1 TaxID=1692240 RepID=UPI0018DFD99C